MYDYSTGTTVTATIDKVVAWRGVSQSQSQSQGFQQCRWYLTDGGQLFPSFGLSAGEPCISVLSCRKVIA